MKESVLNGKSILAANAEFGFQEVFNLPRWKRHLMKLEGIFSARWGEDPKKTDEEFWKSFDEKSKHMIVW